MLCKITSDFGRSIGLKQKGVGDIRLLDLVKYLRTYTPTARGIVYGFLKIMQSLGYKIPDIAQLEKELKKVDKQDRTLSDFPEGF